MSHMRSATSSVESKDSIQSIIIAIKKLEQDILKKEKILKKIQETQDTAQKLYDDTAQGLAQADNRATLAAAAFFLFLASVNENNKTCYFISATLLLSLLAKHSILFSMARLNRNKYTIPCEKLEQEIKQLKEGKRLLDKLLEEKEIEQQIKKQEQKQEKEEEKEKERAKEKEKNHLSHIIKLLETQKVSEEKKKKENPPKSQPAPEEKPPKKENPSATKSSEKIKKIDQEKKKADQLTKSKLDIQSTLNQTKHQAKQAIETTDQKLIESQIKQIKSMTDLSKSNSEFIALIATLNQKIDILTTSIHSIEENRNNLNKLESSPEITSSITDIDAHIELYKKHLLILSRQIKAVEKEKSTIMIELSSQTTLTKKAVSELTTLHDTIKGLDKKFDRVSNATLQKEISDTFFSLEREFNKKMHAIPAHLLTEQQTKLVGSHQSRILSISKKYKKIDAEKDKKNHAPILKDTAPEKKPVENKINSTKNKSEKKETTDKSFFLSSQSPLPIKNVFKKPAEDKEDDALEDQLLNQFVSKIYHQSTKLKTDHEKRAFFQHAMHKLEIFCKRNKLSLSKGKSFLGDIPGYVETNKKAPATVLEEGKETFFLTKIESHITNLGKIYKRPTTSDAVQEKYAKHFQSVNSMNALNQCLELMTSESFFPNVNNLNILIEKLSLYASPEIAHNLFEMAQKNHQINSISYEIMFDIAYSYGWKAIAESLVDFYSHSITDASKKYALYLKMMDLYIEDRDYDGANNLYKRAASLENCVEVALHIKMMHAAIHSGHPQEAIDLYNHVKNFSECKHTFAIHKIAMMAHIKNKDCKKAQEIGETYLFVPKTFKKEAGKYRLDLHEYSYGNAYITLKKLIDQADKGTPIQVIYGKGLSSTYKDAEGYHSLKRAVFDLLQTPEYHDQYQLREDERNTGQATIQYRPSYVLTNTLFSSSQQAIALGTSKERRDTEFQPGSH